MPLSDPPTPAYFALMRAASATHLNADAPWADDSAVLHMLGSIRSETGIRDIDTEPSVN
jgi:hypothetical protein